MIERERSLTRTVRGRSSVLCHSTKGVRSFRAMTPRNGFADRSRMRTTASRIALVLSLMAVALVARAATPEQVAADASALVADTEALGERVEDCPGGTCADADDIRATFTQVVSREDLLVADRATLPAACGCQEIDAAIARIHQLSDVLGVTLGGWDEES